MRRNSLGRARGFTLLELLLAVAIVAFALVTIAAAVSNGIAIAGEASNLRVAREACRAKLESVVSGTETSQGGPIEGHETFQWSLAREEKTVGVGDSPTEKYHVITVTVTYPSDTAPSSPGQPGQGTIKLTTIVDPPDLKDAQKK
ncbi:type II secretion system protein [bacterium]|nr:type II secretion system protein [bacterium]